MDTLTNTDVGPISVDTYGFFLIWPRMYSS